MQDILYLNQKLKIANEVKLIRHKRNILTIYSILLTKASAVDSREHAGTFSCKKKKIHNSTHFQTPRGIIK